MNANNTVQIKYRHVEIAAAAPLDDLGDGTFRLALETPPPVRTVLAIAGPSGSRAYVVTAVVEAPPEGSTRGCVVREVPLDRLPTTVGTERLADSALGAAESSATGATGATDSGEDQDDAYGAHMAVPAPVISEDTSGPRDLSEGDTGGEGDAGPSDNGEGTDESATTGDGGASRAKKRRGRQRK